MPYATMTKPFALAGVPFSCTACDRIIAPCHCSQKSRSRKREHECGFSSFAACCYGFAIDSRQPAIGHITDVPVLNKKSRATALSHYVDVLFGCSLLLPINILRTRKAATLSWPSPVYGSQKSVHNDGRTDGRTDGLAVCVCVYVC